MRRSGRRGHRCKDKKVARKSGLAPGARKTPRVGGRASRRGWDTGAWYGPRAVPGTFR